MIVNSLRFEILNAMVDDWEDAEQVYLSINRERLMVCGQPRELLVRVVDELLQMLSERLIEAQRSWDETIAPLSTLDLTRIHYYWFFPTQKGLETWRSCKNQN